MSAEKKLGNQEKNNQLLAALRADQSLENNIQLIASELFEKMSGLKLSRETDVSNGEDYHYLSGKDECACSLRFHPQVSHWFGWHTNSGDAVPNVDSLVMFDTKQEVIDALEYSFIDYQKKSDSSEMISLNGKPILQGYDIFGLFMGITGEVMFIGKDNYDKQEHIDFHEWIENQIGISLTGELSFYDTIDDEIYTATIKSLCSENKK